MAFHAGNAQSSGPLDLDHGPGRAQAYSHRVAGMQSEGAGWNMFDRSLYEKYDVAGPRYTSYPTAPQFHAGFGAEDYRRAAADSAAPARPLSLYVHIPFCESLCYYCACTKVITRRPERGTAYLRRLEAEIAMHGALFDSGRVLRQLHLGGGTPTFLADAELEALMETITAHFTPAPAGEREFGIEVDPRALGPETLETLGAHGFNRMSLGVQDFDARVQRAVNRVQSVEAVAAVVDRGRRAGFSSVAFDLIYGLPYQSLASFDATLDEVIALAPDQISVYNYAHLPQRVKAQRLIAGETLPAAGEKLAILARTIERLDAAGYLAIGLDHFARPDSDLARAMENGTLQRNFQGYSTHAECDLIAAGNSAIGFIDGHYSQNASDLPTYYATVDAGRLPIVRGYRLDADDRLRRRVINALMCRSSLEYAPIERAFEISFDDHFCRELAALEPMEADGLLQREPRRIRILPKGRFFLRNIAMVFDRYLQSSSVQYSRTL